MSRRLKPVYRLEARELALVASLARVCAPRGLRAPDTLPVQALYAVSRLLNTNLPLPTIEMAGRSMLDFRGLHVLVRLNHQLDGDLFWTPKWDEDVAVLCYPAAPAEFPDARAGIQVAGWLTRNEWRGFAVEREGPRGPVMAVRQELLFDFRDLLAYSPAVARQGVLI